jgi:hypothetical protein
MPLPHNTLIESLENEVKNGTFTSWAFANRTGRWCSIFADEACPPDHLLDKAGAHAGEKSSHNQWFPAFDLASLTKPLLTNLWLRLSLGTDPILYADTPLSALLEERTAEGRLLKNWAMERPWVTLSHVLNHKTGLPAWCWFGRMLWEFPDETAAKKAARRSAGSASDDSGETARRAQLQLTRHILSMGANNSNPEALYSDLNYFLMARICENIALTQFKSWQDCLDVINTACSSSFWHASLDPERSMTAVPFYPYVHSQVTAHIYENRKLENHAGQFGSVHDTNANILAHEFRASRTAAPMVSGHAGLFGSVADVAAAAKVIIETQSELNNHPTKLKCSDERFVWGMDTPSQSDSTAGLNLWPLSQNASVFGHLGYTGTSLWLSSSHEFHVFLTNRTAQRNTRGALTTPRILFFHEESTGNTSCWLRNTAAENTRVNTVEGNWKSISCADAYALCFEHSRLVTRYWDRNTLRMLPNLNQLRRELGKSLWTQ